MAISPTSAPQGQSAAGTGDLYVSFELADKRWKLTISDGRRGPSRYSIDAGDVVAVLDSLNRARSRCNLASGCKAHSCYEAGRDGWWLHRWLQEQGIDNIVVDAASIEVNRRSRRAKTDRLDGDKLLAMLLRHLNGERVWSVLREPSREAEDERRTHRELGRLTHERVAQQTRIQALLVLHNLRPQIVIGGRDWQSRVTRPEIQTAPGWPPAQPWTGQSKLFHPGHRLRHRALARSAGAASGLALRRRSTGGRRRATGAMSSSCALQLINSLHSVDNCMTLHLHFAMQ